MSLVPERGRTRVLVASLVALGGAVLVAALLTAWSSSSSDSPATEAVRRVGLMHVGTDHVPSSWPSLRARLAELGWADGENIELIWRNLEPDEAAEQARQFVFERVDVIVAFEDQSIDAAREATTGAQPATSRAPDPIPIVFLHPSDPVRDGLVETLARPDKNLTGVYGARDVVAKQLELYQALVPRLQRLLTLVDPDDKRTKRLLPELRTAAGQLSRSPELDVREVSNEQDFRRTFRSLRPGEVDGVFLLSPRLRLNHTALTIRLAKRAGLPVHAHRKEWVEQGALFSYGIDLPLVGRHGARYVDSLLKGTALADLPVEEVPKTEFAINLETAGRLGIRIPQDTIIGADFVYR
jgi:putative tryptophan/tyrosine transport system substrate-binding protein